MIILTLVKPGCYNFRQEFNEVKNQLGTMSMTISTMATQMNSQLSSQQFLDKEVAELKMTCDHLSEKIDDLDSAVDQPRDDIVNETCHIIENSVEMGKEV